MISIVSCVSKDVRTRETRTNIGDYDKMAIWARATIWMKMSNSTQGVNFVLFKNKN